MGANEGGKVDREVKLVKQKYRIKKTNITKMICYIPRLRAAKNIASSKSNSKYNFPNHHPKYVLYLVHACTTLLSPLKTDLRQDPGTLLARELLDPLRLLQGCLQRHHPHRMSCKGHLLKGIKHNRLTSDELLSNDRGAVAFVSC